MSSWSQTLRANAGTLRALAGQLELPGIGPLRQTRGNDVPALPDAGDLHLDAVSSQQLQPVSLP